MRAFSNWLAERPSSFAVMTFGMKVKVLQPFSNDPRKLDEAFKRLLKEPNGLSTHAYDAVDDAIRLLVRHAPGKRNGRLVKRAIVVITDGFPCGDTVKPATVIERANAADVSVYTVTLPSFPNLRMLKVVPIPTPLDVSGLAESTGGINFYADAGDFQPLFSALGKEVTTSFLLAFYPPEEKRSDGRFHTIRVDAAPGFTVHQSRPGYTAVSP